MKHYTYYDYSIIFSCYIIFLSIDLFHYTSICQFVPNLKIKILSEDKRMLYSVKIRLQNCSIYVLKGCSLCELVFSGM